MKVWEGKPVIGFLLTWGLLRSQLQRQNKAKYFSDPLHRWQGLDWELKHSFRGTKKTQMTSLKSQVMRDISSRRPQRHKWIRGTQWMYGKHLKTAWRNPAVIGNFMTRILMVSDSHQVNLTRICRSRSFLGHCKLKHALPCCQLLWGPRV